MTFQEAVERLKTFEDRLKEKAEYSTENQNNLMFTQSEQTSYHRSSSSSRGRGRGRGGSSNRGRGRGLGQARNQEASQSRDTKGFGQSNNRPKPKKDKSEIQCLRFFLNEEKVIPTKFKSKDKEENPWYLDNGASNHMTGNKSLFLELNERVTGKVRFGDDSRVDIAGKGSIVFKTKIGEHVVLMEVYYIPSVYSNIISLGQLTETSCKIVMEDDVLLVYDRAKTLMIKVLSASNRLYKINLQVGSPVCYYQNLMMIRGFGMLV
uniref:uncharacterized protein LOC122592785 n=1 Tax=Erigeron canadensis TaxID=72917 RepID=UPI001CB8A402|nr:uncharacterized protein LOC122592785 [Erigeron canadensis]